MSGSIHTSPTPESGDRGGSFVSPTPGPSSGGGGGGGGRNRKKNRSLLSPNSDICIDEEVKIGIQIALDKFRQNEDMKEYEFPSSFTSTERAYIHRMCLNYGFTSRSKGKNANRFITIRRKDAGMMGPAEYQFSRQSRNQVYNLMQRYPVSTRERHDLVPRAVRSPNEGGQYREVIKSSGCLTNGIPQIPPARIESDLSEFRKNLPVYSSKDDIMMMLKNHQVILVSGETGSGKTTQIPQYILEDCRQRNQSCRIFCTQPRRLSALAVAERVSAERGEKVGHTVGYQIRLESRVSPKTLLTFCTNGVLLRTLMTGYSFMATVTHVIVDEIHERDRFSDFLLLLLRDILVQNQGLKLILMSATFNTELFQKYFNGCPIFHVPGTLFNIKEYFLGDIFRITGYTTPEMVKAKKELSKLESQQKCLEEWCNDTDVSQVTSDLSNTELSSPQTETEDCETNKEIQTEYPDIEPWITKEMDQAISDAWLQSDEDAFNQMFHFILSENVSVDYCHSEKGVTPLMVAAGQGMTHTVETLLNLGADTNLKASNGWTALDWAKKFDRKDTVDLIETYIASNELSFDPTTNPDLDLQEDDPEIKQLLQVYHKCFDDDTVNLDLIVYLLYHICKESPSGSVLIFLPGYDEIVRLRDRLLNDEKQFNNSDKYQIFTLHSSMQSSDQRRVFKSVPTGCRKVILSTNLAETSITIDDVVYVIDSGKVKEKSFDAIQQVSMLKNVWVSKASAKQRKGRAGRCLPGVCYHLFSRVRHTNLQENQDPEILRYPLQELCLHTKLLARPNTQIADFLSKALQPPSYPALRSAVTLLQTIDALDTWEDLTELGHHLADLPIDPKLGKMVLYSIVLKCLDPVLTIACSLAYRDPFILPSHPAQKRDALQARKKFAAETYSDHMALLRAFQAWQKARNDGWERQFCERNFISAATMEMIVGMRAQLLGHLRAAGFVRARGGGDIRDLNTNSENWAVVKAALTAGVYPNIARIDKSQMQVRTQKESKVRFHSTSVIYNAPKGRVSLGVVHNDTVKCLPTEWLIYDEMVRAFRFVNVRCGTLVSPITVALVAGPARLPQDSLSFNEISSQYDIGGGDQGSDSEAEEKDIEKKATLKLDGWISFKVDPEAAGLCLQLRQKWHSLFIRRMKAPSKPWSQVDESVVQSVVSVLSNEEQVLGLQQPPGIGQRPRPMSADYLSSGPVSPNRRGSIDSDDSSMSTGTSSRTASRCSMVSPSDRRHGGYRSFDDKSDRSSVKSDSSRSCSPAVTPPLTGYEFCNNSRPVRYFIIKAPNTQCIDESLSSGVWDTNSAIERKLNRAFKESHVVYLIFSVQGSGQFQGFVRIVESSRQCDGISGKFRIEWVKRANVPLQSAQYLLSSRSDKGILNRDGQELEPQIGEAICRFWETLHPLNPQNMMNVPQQGMFEGKDASAAMTTDQTMGKQGRSGQMYGYNHQGQFNEPSMWQQQQMMNEGRFQQGSMRGNAPPGLYGNFNSQYQQQQQQQQQHGGYNNMSRKSHYNN